MKKIKRSLLLVGSLAAALLLTACGNNATAKKDTTSDTASSVQSSSSGSANSASSSETTAASSDKENASTSESSEPGWVDNSNNPVENNGAGGHSPQADPNAPQPDSEASTSGRAWVLVYVDKSGEKHESTVSSSYKELQDKANALLASGEATSYYFIQK